MHKLFKKRFKLTLFFTLILFTQGSDKLQEYKAKYYDGLSKPKITVSKKTIKKKLSRVKNNSTDFDFSFMEEKKIIKSTRKRRLKSFTLKKILKKEPKKKPIKKQQTIDPLELQTHMVLSQAKMHKNTSALKLLLKLEKENKDSPIPQKAIGFYYLHKKEVKKAIKSFEKAAYHKNPSFEAAQVLLKLYKKNGNEIKYKKLKKLLVLK
ncbi:MAG: hypothetical protein COB02_01215 [Candidatus Cloacimonadota bacterium]|nr:MAG: hypothetical protein COB02_01215 [Candidatus Cloacimonadota bacterium]